MSESSGDLPIINQIDELLEMGLLDLSSENKLEASEASAQAKEIAQLQDGLVAAVDRYTGEEVTTEGTLISRFNFKGKPGSKIYLAMGINSRHNLGARHVTFEHYHEGVDPTADAYGLGPIRLKDVNKLLGVNTRHYIGIGLHTDQPTLKAIEKLEESQPGRSTGEATYYYFDNDGNFAKVVRLPQDIADDGRKAFLHLFGDRYVASEMTEKDFKLARIAVNQFLKQLN